MSDTIPINEKLSRAGAEEFAAGRTRRVLCVLAVGTAGYVSARACEAATPTVVLSTLPVLALAAWFAFRGRPSQGRLVASVERVTGHPYKIVETESAMPAAARTTGSAPEAAAAFLDKRARDASRRHLHATMGVMAFSAALALGLIEQVYALRPAAAPDKTHVVVPPELPFVSAALAKSLDAEGVGNVYDRVVDQIAKIRPVVDHGVTIKEAFREIDAANLSNSKGRAEERSRHADEAIRLLDGVIKDVKALRETGLHGEADAACDKALEKIDAYKKLAEGVKAGTFDVNAVGGGGDALAEVWNALVNLLIKVLQALLSFLGGLFDGLGQGNAGRAAANGAMSNNPGQTALGRAALGKAVPRTKIDPVSPAPLPVQGRGTTPGGKRPDWTQPPAGKATPGPATKAGPSARGKTDEKPGGGDAAPPTAPPSK